MKVKYNMLITSKHLKGVCDESKDLFKKMFPKGAKLNQKNAIKFFEQWNKQREAGRDIEIQIRGTLDMLYTGNYWGYTELGRGFCDLPHATIPEMINDMFKIIKKPK